MTDTYELPALPERFAVLPKLVLPEVHGMGGNTTVFEQQDAFTADQMREYARAAIAADRERIVEKVGGLDCAHVCGIGHEIAAAIRAG
jgi:hypothetical protein